MWTNNSMVFPRPVCVVSPSGNTLRNHVDNVRKREKVKDSCTKKKTELKASQIFL